MALIHIGGKSYELVLENRNGWNPEAFRNRYSEVLERYDFIIGDWGYNQLRLKGFFRDNHQKATKDSSFSSMSDYINEYCNFGCAYFILEKMQGARREVGEDDVDLDLEYGYDPSKAAEGDDVQGIEESAAISSITATDETATALEATKSTTRESQSQQSRGRQGSNQRNERVEGSGRSAGGEGQGRRKDHQYRNKNHRSNDNRGKKPMKLAAASEAAVSSESTGNTNPNTNPNNKNAGRS